MGVALRSAGGRVVGIFLAQFEEIAAAAEGKVLTEFPIGLGQWFIAFDIPVHKVIGHFLDRTPDSFLDCFDVFRRERQVPGNTFGEVFNKDIHLFGGNVVLDLGPKTVQCELFFVVFADFAGFPVVNMEAGADAVGVIGNGINLDLFKLERFGFAAGSDDGDSDFIFGADVPKAGQNVLMKLFNASAALDFESGDDLLLSFGRPFSVVVFTEGDVAFGVFEVAFAAGFGPGPVEVGASGGLIGFVGCRVQAGLSAADGPHDGFLDGSAED